MIKQLLAGAALVAVTLPTFAAPATIPATSVPKAAASQPATAPAEHSAVYKEIMDVYMSGKWQNLGALLHDKEKEIAALSDSEAADMRTLRQAFAECRQDWWDKTKAGQMVKFTGAFWNQRKPMVFDPKNPPRNPDAPVIVVSWDTKDMDSTQFHGHGATLGDFAAVNLLSAIGEGIALSETSKIYGKNTTIYIWLRSDLTSFYYGTPTSRRATLWKDIALCGQGIAKEDDLPSSRAMIMFFLGEVLGHPEKYPSIKFPEISGEITEKTLPKPLIPFIESVSWTFAEDNALRAACKEFATTNGLRACTTETFVFPGGLSMSIKKEPNTKNQASPRLQADIPLAKKRDAWLQEHYPSAPKSKP